MGNALLVKDAELPYDLAINTSNTVCINSIYEINQDIINRNRIGYLIIAQHGATDPNLSMFVKQFKSVYPFITLVFITDSERKRYHESMYHAGADYVLTMKSDLDSLKQNLERIFSKARIKSKKLPILEVGDLILDPNTGDVHRNGDRIPLRNKEFRLLEFMMLNIGKVFGRVELLEVIWDYRFSIFSNTVDVHIANLRAKIDKKSACPLIHTVHGKGYKLDIFR